MKVGVFGAGAVGGVLAARLFDAGRDVHLIARGEHMRQIKNRGLRMTAGAEEFNYAIPVSDDPAAFGEMDVVFCCVKAYSLPQAAGRIASMLGPDTPVVFAMNGVPWWFNHALEGPMAGKRLSSVDPGGVIWRTIGPERALGCAVLMGAAAPEAGRVQYIGGGQLLIGEPDGSLSERLGRIVDLLSVPGFQPTATDNIRGALFVKLLHNVSFNMVCALTHTTMDVVARDLRTRALIRSLMEECLAVAKVSGVKVDDDVEGAIDAVAARGPHRPSTQQDLEAGKPLEFETLCGVVSELGRLGGVPTPYTDAIYALIRRLAETRGLYVGYEAGDEAVAGQAARSAG